MMFSNDLVFYPFNSGIRPGASTSAGPAKGDDEGDDLEGEGRSDGGRASADCGDIRKVYH
jgi:hypothetical protein